MTNKQNSGIQALRAIACLLVVFQHVTFYVCYAKGIDYKPFLPINFGEIGVGLFFVISGYVMGECLHQGPRFLWNRVVRIYPPFWITIVLSFLLLRSSIADWHVDGWSAFLLPSLSLNNSYRIPYWTLCYEMAFYVATYALILCKLSRPQVAICCLVWITVICLLDGYRLTGLVPAPDKFQPGWWLLIAPVSMLFAFGLFVSTADRKFLDAVPTPYLALLAIGIGYVGTKINMETPAPSCIVLAIAYGLAVVTASRITFPRICERVGDYSYGIYLLHVVIIVAMLAALQPVVTTTKFSVLLLLVGATALVGGLLFGWLEHHLYKRYLRNIFRPHSQARLSPQAG